MEESIEKKIINSLEMSESTFKEDALVQQFEEAITKFKELVNKGYAKERGNNLLSVSDQLSNNRVVFNCK